VTPRQTLVVVDGSNLATEGRTIPSLVQLRECVAAFLEEQPTAKTVVVVDATFGHRIAAGERARFKEAELAGEMVTPPAGAIGRGDAFILKIAARSDAVVLSNDSFQEFQETYPWLFDEGRLIGGKPVRGIGWVFTPRLPVRSPSVRKASAQAKRAAAPTSAPTGTASAAAGTAKTPAKAAAAKATRATTVAATKAASAPKAAASPRATATRSAPSSDATPRRRRGTAATPAVATASGPPAPRTSAKRAGAKAAKPDAKPDAKLNEAKPTAAAGSAKRSRRSRGGAAKAAATPAPQKAAAAARTAPSRSRTSASAASEQRGSPTTRDDTPVNSVRAFRALTSRHPVRSTVDGDVASFTSHGAMVTVTVGRGTKVACYVPLSGLGRPAPTRARDVLKLGERRTWRIASYDEDRRIAQLSLMAT
jgi:hypothetical protein